MFRNILILLLVFVFISPNIYSIEREQDGVSEVVSSKKFVMLHFMQGKGFFKEGNYKLAKEEFQKVVELDSDHEMSYLYLTRIDNIEQDVKEKEEKKYQQVDKLLNRIETQKNKDKKYTPSMESVINTFTKEEQEKIDEYVSNSNFKDMIELQRREVVSKTKQVKKEIQDVLTETREESIKDNFTKKEPSELVQEFEERFDMDRDERVKKVKLEQKDKDAEFYFDTKRKLKEYYSRGIRYFKQKDFFNAKKYFFEVMKIEPNYKYVRDYFDECRSRVVLEELRNRKRKSQAYIFNKGRVFEQEPVEYIAGRRELDKSSRISKTLSKGYRKRRRSREDNVKKELLQQGITAYKDKDYIKALDIFDEILEKYSPCRRAKRYKKACKRLLKKKEEEMSLAFNKLKTSILVDRLDTVTDKKVLAEKAKDIQELYKIEDTDKKAAALYKQAKTLYLNKYFEEAKKVFEDILSFKDPYKYSKQYVEKCDEYIRLKSNKLSRADEKKFFVKAMELYSKKKYKEAADNLVETLKINKKNRKAIRYLKYCARYLKVDLGVFLDKISKKKVATKKIVKKEAVTVSTKQKVKEVSVKAEVAKPVVKKAETEAEIYENAKVLYRSGKYKEAKEEFEKVLKLNSNHRYAGRYIDRCKEKVAEQLPVVTKKEEKIKAETAPVKTDIKPVIKKAETETEVYENAKKLYRSGKYKEAIPEFEKVLKFNVNHRYAGRYIERCKEKVAEQLPVVVKKEEKVKEEKAIVKAVKPVVKKVEVAKPVVKKEETEAEAYKNAKKLYRSGKYKEAIPEFEKVLKFNVDHRYAGRYIERCKEKVAEQLPVITKKEEKVKEEKAIVKVVKPAVKKLEVVKPVTKKAETEKEIYKKAKKLYRNGKYKEAISEFEKVLKFNAKHRYAGRYIERCKEKVAEQLSVVVKKEEKVKEVKVKTMPMKADIKPAVKKAEAVRVKTGIKPAIKKLEVVKPVVKKTKVEIKKEDKVKPLVVKEIKKEVIIKKTKVEIEEIYQSAKKLYKNKKYRKSILEFEKVLKLNSNHLYAGKYIEICKKEIAKQGGMKEVEIETKTVVEVYESAKKLYKNKKYKEAILEFENVLKLNPKHLYVKGYIEKCKKKISKRKKPVVKEAVVVKSRKLEKETETYESAKKLYKNEKYKEAIVEFEKVLKINPNDQYAGKYLERAQSKIKIKEQDIIDEAIPILIAQPVQKFSKKVSKKKQAQDLYKQAKELYGQKKYKQAVEGFQRVIKLDSSHVYAGKYLERCKRILTKKQGSVSQEEPKKVLKQAAKLKESSMLRKKEKIYNQGKRLYAQKKYKQAAKEFNSVLELDPKDKFAKRFLIRCENILQKNTKTNKKIVEQEPPMQKIVKEEKAVKKLYATGKMLYRRKQYKEAKDFFEQVLKQESTHENAKKYLVRCENQSKKTKKLLIKKIVKEEKEVEQVEVDKKDAEIKKIAKQAKIKEAKIKKEIEEKQRIAAEKIKKNKDNEARKIAKQVKIKEKQRKKEKLRKMKEARKIVKQKKIKEREERKINARKENAKKQEIYKLQKQGRLAFAKKNYEQSLSFFEELLKIDSKNNIANEYKRKIENKIRKNKTKDLKKDNVGNLLKQGSVFVQKLEYEKAIAVFESVLEIDSKNKLAKIELEKAKESLMKSNKEAKKNLEIFESKYNTARKLYKQGNNKQALEILDELINKHADKMFGLSNIYYLKSKIEFEEKNKVIKEKQVLKEITKKIDFETEFKKAIELYNNSLYVEALKKFKVLEQIFSNNKYIRTFIEYCNEKLIEIEIIEIEKEKINKRIENKQFSEQEEKIKLVLDKKIKLKQDKRKKQEKEIKDIKEIIKKGVSYLEKKEYVTAKKLFEKAKKIDPYRKDILKYIEQCDTMLKNTNMGLVGFVNKGKEAFKNKQYKLAIDELKKAWELKPKGIVLEEIQVLLEVSYELLLKEKIETPNKIKQQDYDNFIKIGNMYIKKGSYDLAVVQFNKALKLYPKSVIAFKFKELAILRKSQNQILDQKLNNIENNKKEMQKILARIESVNELFEDAKLLYSITKYEEALGKFEDLLKLDSGSILFKDYIQLCKEALKIKK
jgi:tetratricopeptide (TPR) repeat protein